MKTKWRGEYDGRQNIPFLSDMIARESRRVVESGIQVVVEGAGRGLGLCSWSGVLSGMRSVTVFGDRRSDRGD